MTRHRKALLRRFLFPFAASLVLIFSLLASCSASPKGGAAPSGSDGETVSESAKSYYEKLIEKLAEEERARETAGDGGASDPAVDVSDEYLGEKSPACYERLSSLFREADDGSDAREAPSPADLIDSLTADGSSPLFCLYHTALDRVRQYPLDDEYALSRAVRLLSTASFERLAPEDAAGYGNPYVNEFLFFSSGDGERRIYLLPHDPYEDLLLIAVDGDAVSVFSAPSARSEGGESEAGERGSFLAYRDFRSLFDGMDASRQNVAFSASSAEEAVRIFAEKIYGRRFLNAVPGSGFAASAYYVNGYETLKTGKQENAVIGALDISIASLAPDPDSFGDMLIPEKGENAGRVTIHSEFLLEKQEDGHWKATQTGVSGLELP